MYEARSFRVVLSFNCPVLSIKRFQKIKYCCIFVVLNNTLLEGRSWPPHTSVRTFEETVGGKGRANWSKRVGTGKSARERTSERDGEKRTGGK